MKPKAIFIDRDGTLVEEVNYLHQASETLLIPGVAGAVAQLKNAGYLLIVVTNQSGIGRGIYTVDEMHSVHDEVQRLLDGAIDGFYYCPHLPCDGCDCRKPGLKMIRDAVDRFGIDLEGSWMVGDKSIDVETGHAAGIQSALVLTGYGREHVAGLDVAPTVVADDFGAVAVEILRLSSAEIVT